MNQWVGTEVPAEWLPP